MNSFTNSFTYLKHRDRYIKAARIRRIKQKLAEYNLTFYIPRQDAEEPFTPFSTIKGGMSKQPTYHPPNTAK